MTEIIELNYPITVDGHEYAKLTMRRPKVRDRLMVDRADISESESESSWKDYKKINEKKFINKT